MLPSRAFESISSWRVLDMDGLSLSLKEIFSVATRLEEDGIEFYEAAAEKANSKRLRDVLDNLIVQEVEHRMVFYQLADESGVHFSPEQKCQEISPSVTEALTEAGVFPTPDEQDSAMRSLHSPMQVLRFAIQAEKRAVDFYKHAARKTQVQKIRSTFERILDEERQHARLLAAELKVLKTGAEAW
jgi:rubrerythrin